MFPRSKIITIKLQLPTPKTKKPLCKGFFYTYFSTLDINTAISPYIDFVNMAPMAGGIPDGQKHGLIFHACFFKGFISPRKPVHRVVGVLLKIAGLFISKAVGIGCICGH
jgi:hypothetical protein